MIFFLNRVLAPLDGGLAIDELEYGHWRGWYRGKTKYDIESCIWREKSGIPNNRGYEIEQGVISCLL